MKAAGRDRNHLKKKLKTTKRLESGLSQTEGVAFWRPRIDPWGARTKEYKEGFDRGKKGWQFRGSESLKREIPSVETVSVQS